jgi:hypothetical protein
MDIILTKNIAEALEAFATAAALFIGGIWTYLRFIRNRLRYPKAELRHKVICELLPEQKRLVHIVLTIVNKGDVLLPICDAWTKLYQISPATDKIGAAIAQGVEPPLDGQAEFDWPTLGCKEITHDFGAAEIEPGESEQLHFEFLIDPTIKAIKVYSYFKNMRKQKQWCICGEPNGEIGWNHTTIHGID